MPDAESIEMIYRILDEEGFYIGASSALNVVAAVKVAEKMEKGSTVVTVLCDGAYRFVFLPPIVVPPSLCSSNPPQADSPSLSIG